MFASLSRFRRETAVLAVLALVASLLVVVPVSAADPKADHPAMYSACVGDAAESAGFTDVPAGHTNAGHIDCIAYYGITKGTSVDTYSPLMLVTREQMALFLTRLAGLVGIEVASDASHPFTDIGDLSEESQTAIGQLADLGITKGNNPSGTTYGPADPVQRDHMALFISRLMKKMTKGIGGATPDDVAKSDSEDKSPFTDLGPTTKSAYDAITQLWELGVASGINDTHYGPAQSITRAAMAGFMAGVLDHSNARPAGLSIQADKVSDYGAITNAVIVVSYRSDDFAPVEGQAVDLFYGTGANRGLEDNGKCRTTGTTGLATVVEGGAVCEQDANDATTDENGNFLITDGMATAGTTSVYYAWTGKSGDKFDADDVDEKTVSITAKLDTAALHISSTISDNAYADEYDSDAGGTTENAALEDDDVINNEPRVDLDVTKSVTFTVQLRDANGGDVSRADQSISVTVVMAGSTTSTNTYKVKTDANGKITYTINAPTDRADTGSNIADDRRLDTVTFKLGSISQTRKVLWLEDDPVRTSTKATVSRAYTVISSGSARVAATVTIYDQYGNLHRVAGQKVSFTVPSGATAVERGAAGGRATYTGTAASPTAGTAVGWSATVVDDGDAATVEPPVDTSNAGVTPVNVATDDSRATGLTVAAIYAKEDKFRAGSAATPTDGSTLYTYDSDDTFLHNGARVSMDKFEVQLGKNITGTPSQVPVVTVVLYDDDGGSIFDVTTAASE